MKEITVEGLTDTLASEFKIGDEYWHSGMSFRVLDVLPTRATGMVSFTVSDFFQNVTDVTFYAGHRLERIVSVR